ncbi:hypothetical protein SIAM614_17539 [Stappia aggregata IAM 12614]|uniref:Uncharacterized protein n=2 Tax=Roseibium aggregatum TaxID=187304 RepID=A0P2H4_ROSAI|nr:hypothetical protein SIAM614_17539 [Stappia aggregata IAM 12614] [Roseibium aggregatum IAM 12614]
MVCFICQVAIVKGGRMLKQLLLGGALAAGLSCQVLAGPLQDKVGEAEAALEAGNGGEAIAVMRQALFDIWSKASLSIPTALFVRAPADGYGIYTPRADAAFAPDEALRIYLEPVGFDWKQQDGLYTSLLTVDFDLASPDGKVLAGQKGFGRFDFKSHVPNTEYMANLTLNVSGAPSGDYVLELTVNDEYSGKTAKVRMPFSIK